MTGPLSLPRATPSPADPGSDRLPQPLAGWLDAVLAVAGHYRLDVSRERLRVALSWNDPRALQRGVREAARQAGLRLRWVEPRLDGLSAWRLPLAVQLRDGQVAVIVAVAPDGLRLSLSGDQGLESTIPADELRAAVTAMAVMRPVGATPDSRVDDYFKPVEQHWLRSIVFADLRPYVHVMIASLVANLMALAGILFSMQVYDRVIPAQSQPTLYVLFSGVMLALAFAWFMQNARRHIIDVVGKRSDLRVSDRVFGHALRIRNTARPKATGTFVGQIRELEPVRDMLTSTTVAAIADLPFFLVFCFIFWTIAGSLVWIPLAAFALLMLPSLLAQKRLRALAQESMRESSLRSSMLVEAVQGIEDIKLLQAEPSFQNRWNHYNAVDADSNLRMRELLHRLGNWIQTVQGGAFAVVVFFGAPMVMAGEISTGVLVAASILSSRMLAPLAGVAQVLNRWQQARVATEALDGLMQLPVDHAGAGTRVQRPVLEGRYALRQALFSYDGTVPALRVGALSIQPGERIAVLGRNGSGKSTLLQALSGLLEPQMGAILLDGVALGHIDPADVRRDVSLLTQHARLFHGTLRDNLRLGAPHAADADLAAALQQAGAWSFVQRLPMGLDYPVQEGGLGLSGGQRQSLLLARLLLRDPRVLLLDEPTASLDDATEREVIGQLRDLSQGRTLVVATHRPALLDIVDRIIVLSSGAVALDGPRDEVLATLRRKPDAAAAPPMDAQASATAVQESRS
ncbi:type I secretion system permease/ATPase [Castellaniella hirudinis]|uniref:Type I secretion system permease/ATPase n=1 Tax=Castellaniella hirudinis TaxID=1144617 RepID=A0ABV8S0I8_9BURK